LSGSSTARTPRGWPTASPTSQEPALHRAEAARARPNTRASRDPCSAGRRRPGSAAPGVLPGPVEDGIQRQRKGAAIDIVDRQASSGSSPRRPRSTSRWWRSAMPTLRRAPASSRSSRRTTTPRGFKIRRRQRAVQLDQQSCKGPNDRGGAATTIGPGGAPRAGDVRPASVATRPPARGPRVQALLEVRVQAPSAAQGRAPPRRTGGCPHPVIKPASTAPWCRGPGRSRTGADSACSARWGEPVSRRPRQAPPPRVAVPLVAGGPR
jgi:hypothetical protein